MGRQCRSCKPKVSGRSGLACTLKTAPRPVQMGNGAHWGQLGPLGSPVTAPILVILTTLTSCVTLSLNEARVASAGLDLPARGRFSSRINNPIISRYTINYVYLQEDIVNPLPQSPSRSWPTHCLFYKTSHQAYKQGDLHRLLATVEQLSPSTPPSPLLPLS